MRRSRGPDGDVGGPIEGRQTPTTCSQSDALTHAAEAYDAENNMYAASRCLLGMLHIKLDPPDLNSARRWLERTVEAGYRDAMFNLGVLYTEQMDPPDLTAACGWFKRAAEAGNSDAVGLLGFLYARRMDPPDLGFTRRPMRKSANITRRNPRRCRCVGEHHCFLQQILRVGLTIRKPRRDAIKLIAERQHIALKACAQFAVGLH